MYYINIQQGNIAHDEHNDNCLSATRAEGCGALVKIKIIIRIDIPLNTEYRL